MQAITGEVIGEVDESYPLQKKGTSLEHLRDIAHLRARTNLFGAVLYTPSKPWPASPSVEFGKSVFFCFPKSLLSCFAHAF